MGGRGHESGGGGPSGAESLSFHQFTFIVLFLALIKIKQEINKRLTSSTVIV